MSIQAKTAVNELALHQKAESLNRAFNEKEPISLADLRKKLLLVKVCSTAETVLGICAGGFALSINPTATILGGLVGAFIIACDDGLPFIKSSPKFEVKNSQIVQTNYEYTRELEKWHTMRKAVLFIDTISAGSLTASYQYPNSTLGGDSFSNCFSFYSGLRGVVQVYNLTRKFI